MRTNTRATAPDRTYEGGVAVVKTKDQLERLVATCMLFEQTFYEKGDTQAANIAKACAEADPREIAAVAIKAREVFKLRHVPLFLLVQLNMRRLECAKPFPSLVRETVARVIQRPDEAGELLRLLVKDAQDANKLFNPLPIPIKPITVKSVMSHAIEKGIAAAMRKFSEYQLAKWNRPTEIKLRDVLFLTHPKPKLGSNTVTRLVRKYKNGEGTVLRHGEGQGKVWASLVDGTIESADTWEVALSAGANKKATWERLITGGKLGYMALLMNLRNMTTAKVDRVMVEKAIIKGAPKSKALPFRFLTAERHAPTYSGVLSDALLSAVAEQKGTLPGKTLILVDVSGSMVGTKISAKSELDRLDAAAALAVLAKEVCESSVVYAFSNNLIEVRNARGIPLADNLRRLGGGGTNLQQSMRQLVGAELDHDRLIIVTDEQSHDGIMSAPVPVWILNVASYMPVLQVSKNVRRLNGFSERILDFIKYDEGIETTLSDEE